MPWTWRFGTQLCWHAPFGCKTLTVCLPGQILSKCMIWIMDVKPSDRKWLDGSHHKCFIYLLLAKFLSLSLLFTVIFLITLYLFVTTLHPSTSLHLIISIYSTPVHTVCFIFQFLYLYLHIFVFSSYFYCLCVVVSVYWKRVTLKQIPCMLKHTWQ